MRRRQEPLLSLETLLWLQTTSGNRAVQRLLARKAKQRADEQKPGSQAEGESRGRHRVWWRRLLTWFAELKRRIPSIL
jgi:hypothetical protein